MRSKKRREEDAARWAYVAEKEQVLLSIVRAVAGAYFMLGGRPDARFDPYAADKMHEAARVVARQIYKYGFKRGAQSKKNA